MWIFLIVLLSANLAFAAPVYEKVDSQTVKSTETVELTYKLNFLLQQREQILADIARAETELKNIDELIAIIQK